MSGVERTETGVYTIATLPAMSSMDLKRQKLVGAGTHMTLRTSTTNATAISQANAAIKAKPVPAAAAKPGRPQVTFVAAKSPSAALRRKAIASGEEEEADEDDDDDLGEDEEEEETEEEEAEAREETEIPSESDTGSFKTLDDVKRFLDDNNASPSPSNISEEEEEPASEDSSFVAAFNSMKLDMTPKDSFASMWEQY